MMKRTLSNDHLTNYVQTQMNRFIPDTYVDFSDLKEFVKRAMERVEYCFSKINIKNFWDGKNVLFNHLHTDQYAMFLYFLSNTVWLESKNEAIASKLYYLNKIMHSVDIYYEVNLPDIFLLSHPVGTVLGRARYSDYFVAYQRVTVGGNLDLQYPNIEKGVTMFGGSALIGECKIGENCLISAGTIIIDKKINRDTICFQKSHETVFKKNHRKIFDIYFRD